jgi:two-component system, NtrC family, sensor kinase
MKENTSSSRPERVLVVDDSRQIRDFLADYILTPHGFEVIMAEDGIEGLRLAFDTHPDLMIVDVQMPSMGGLELLRRLQLRRLNVPAILITAHGSEQVAVDALRLGVRDYVVKPFDVPQMEEAIERALRESRLEDSHGELERRLEQHEHNLRQLAQQINALFSFSRFLAANRDANVIDQRAVEVAAYIASADLSALFVLDPVRGELVIRASHNTREEPAPVSLQSNAVAHVLRTRQTTVLDASAARKALPAGPALQNLAYVPLVAGAEAMGVLSVASRVSGRAMSQRDRRLLAIMASLTAQALLNSELAVQAGG